MGSIMIIKDVCRQPECRERGPQDMAVTKIEVRFNRISMVATASHLLECPVCTFARWQRYEGGEVALLEVLANG